jgi:hypothetical protein
MLQTGLRTHDYGYGEPEAVADILAAYKPASIQLALAKAFLQETAKGLCL